MVVCWLLQGERAWLRAALGVMLIAGLSGCPLTPAPVPAAPTAQQAVDAATGVTVAAAPARRLLVTRDENQSRSRVLAIWLRIENPAGTVLSFDPDHVTLSFADGSAGSTLDRDRSSVLIDRVSVGPTDEAAADYPDLWNDANQSGLKQQLRDGLLTARELGSEPLEGYIVFDTKQPAAPIDGAVLQIMLVRGDGAVERVIYNFTSAPPATAAQQ